MLFQVVVILAVEWLKGNIRCEVLAIFLKIRLGLFSFWNCIELYSYCVQFSVFMLR